MSIFVPLTVKCPTCEDEFDVDIVESVNADRRPDLREAIVDGSFQVVSCSHCAVEFRLDPMFNYLDIGRGQWLSVLPADRMPDWIDSEDEANQVFALAYGDQAPGAANEIGKDLSPRLVFGWPALREKLTAKDLEINDVTLELTKLAVIESTGGGPISQGAELRLLSQQDDNLVFGWIVANDDNLVEGLTVPHALFQSIVDKLEDWNEIEKQLQSGPFVDIQKLFFGAGRV